jgi:threonine dehydratase
LDEAAGADIFLKCENFQHVGAFKARGACNAVLSLDEAAARRGVVTHSSGNHAAAVARAAAIRGVPATIVMPHNSAANKIEAVKSYGVRLVLCEPTAEARQSTADAVIAETGGTLIHPYDDPRTIAGQGTVALELLEQTEGLDVLLVPVGGGGLLSGCLIVIKTLRPQMQVFAAEPALADDAYRSLHSGRIEPPLRYDTIADGLRTPLGTHTFPIIRRLVDEILLVEEAEIVRCTRLLLEAAKLVVEPSGAVPLAALMNNTERFQGRKVGIVLSGGNLNLDNLPWSTA